MEVLIIVIAVLVSYGFVGSFSFSRKLSIESRKCPQKNCFQKNGGNRWCSHVTSSLWLAGVFWPFGLPMLLGAKMGATDGLTRRQRKDQRELEREQHKHELARINAIETKKLERELELIGKGVEE